MATLTPTGSWPATADRLKLTYEAGNWEYTEFSATSYDFRAPY